MVGKKKSAQWLCQEAGDRDWPWRDMKNIWSDGNILYLARNLGDTHMHLTKLSQRTLKICIFHSVLTL